MKGKKNSNNNCKEKQLRTPFLKTGHVLLFGVCTVLAPHTTLQMLTMYFQS